MQNSFNKLSYIVTEIKEGTDICDTSKICKNKTTYLLLYKLTKVKEKSKELINSVTIYRLGAFSILFLTSNLAEIGASD